MLSGADTRYFNKSRAATFERHERSGGPKSGSVLALEPAFIDRAALHAGLGALGFRHSCRPVFLRENNVRRFVYNLAVRITKQALCPDIPS
jgi:hypothetical protein